MPIPAQNFPPGGSGGGRRFPSGLPPQPPPISIRARVRLPPALATRDHRHGLFAGGRMLGALFLVVGLAVGEGWFLTSVLEFHPIWTFVTVLGTLVTILAALVLRAARSHSD